MNEIIIDDKKYISSKQAAKITGYAKDYVGQLCREGRVPARLVGRSWYVLESAIQDHRFGKDTEEDSDTSKETDAEEAWESPRYESADAEALPGAGHSRVMSESEVDAIVVGSKTTHSNLSDAWQEWFAHVTGSISSSDEPEITKNNVSGAENQDESVHLNRIHEEEPMEHVETSTAVSESVHIQRVHTIDNPIRIEPEQERTASQTVRTPRHGSTQVTEKRSGASALFRVLLVAVAVLAVGLVLLNSGVFDASVIANSQAHALAGITVLIK